MQLQEIAKNSWNHDKSNKCGSIFTLPSDFINIRPGNSYKFWQGCHPLNTLQWCCVKKLQHPPPCVVNGNTASDGIKSTFLLANHKTESQDRRLHQGKLLLGKWRRNEVKQKGIYLIAQLHRYQNKAQCQHLRVKEKKRAGEKSSCRGW